MALAMLAVLPQIIRRNVNRSGLEWTGLALIGETADGTLNPLRPASSTESAMINSYQMQLSWLQVRAENNFIVQPSNCERADWICSRMACRIGSVLAKQICLADSTSLKD